MADTSPPTQRDPQVHQPLPVSETETDVGSCFDRVAALWPDRIAVDTGESRVSYRALASASDAICGRILHACGGEASRVALICERPAALVTAILGVLKAGCAYVPLDPRFPAARLHYILKDADVALVLCDGATEALAREIVGGERILLDVEDGRGTPQTMRPTVAPDQVASILYTSGSTSEPKGVLQNHRNLVQYARNYIATLEMRPADRMSLLFSYGFSASVPDIFGSLLCGATLCPFDLRRHGFTALAKWVDDAEISLLHFVPTVFRHFARRAEEAGPFHALRTVDLGGEAVFAADVDTFRRFSGPDCSLVHRLAATEMSLITALRVSASDEVAAGTLPVGRALPGVEVHIEGEDGSRLAVGEVGEIVLRSRFVSPGYWRRPELTAAKFRDDPAADGLRTFRTGDRGRIDADGCLEHCGRSSQRAKIHGHTVELAEVEARLRALPGVLDCAVAALERAGADSLLVGFILPESGENGSAARFRRELADHLPGWMVPARFDFPGEFPMTATGKVDRAQLLANHRANGERNPAVPPRTSVEQTLVSIWREALGDPSLGVLDDYIELGGSSLAAVQIVAGIEEKLGFELAPSTLVERPTIAALAAWLEAGHSAGSLGRVVKLKAGAGAPPLFCFPGNGGDPIVFQAFARHLDSERPCYGLRPPGRFGHGGPPRRVEELAGSLVDAVRGVQARGPYYFVGFSFGSTVAAEVARILRSQDEEVPIIAMVDGWAPGHPQLRRDRPIFHRLADRALGRGLLERQRQSAGRILWQALKGRLRDLECAVPEMLGRDLSPKLRRRRQKRWAIRARARYRPTIHAGRILLVRASEPMHGDVFDYSPTRGWKSLAQRGVAILELPGTHLEMLTEPNARRVASWIDDEIDAERAASDG